MGLSSSKTKTTQNATSTTAPSAYNQPYIDSAAATLAPSFQAAQANNASLLPRVNSTLDYFQKVRDTAPTANPYLDGIIKTTGENVTNGVTSQFSRAGRYGSGMFAGTLAKALADNEGALRYQDYTAQQGRSDDAARSLLGGVGVSAALPQAAAGTYADQIRALVGGYNTGTSSGTNTSTSTPSFLQQLAMLAQVGSSVAGGFGGGR